MNELYSWSIYGAFAANVKKYPDKVALAFLGSKWSFRQLDDLSERFAAVLMRLGIVAADRVLLYLPNIPQAMIAFLGIQRLGAIPVAISSIYTVDELRYMDLIGFRRLCKTPEDIVSKVKEKINLLEEENYAKRLDGIKAWRQNSVNKIYLEIGHESINQKKR